MRRIAAFAAAAVMLLAAGCSSADTGGGDSEGKTYLPAETSAAENSSGIKTQTAPPAETDDSTGAEQPDPDVIFDTLPLSRAYLSDDLSGLDDFQKQILFKAAQVVKECTDESMTPYEKEMALHDWLIRSCTYDKGALRAIKQPGEHASDPYGALIDGQAICMGYTTAFKLFMEMIGIPCGIIHSTDAEGDEHAWNIVQLDGSWYYVDTTWDDPVPDKNDGYVKHQFFNITRDEIAIEHILPADAPAADSTEYLFAEHELYTVTDLSQLSDGIKAALERGHRDLPVRFDTGIDLKDGVLFPSDTDYYSISDKELREAVTDACREAGCQFAIGSLRSSAQGDVLLIIFNPDN